MTVDLIADCTDNFDDRYDFEGTTPCRKHPARDGEAQLLAVVQPPCQGQPSTLQGWPGAEVEVCGDLTCDEYIL